MQTRVCSLVVLTLLVRAVIGPVPLATASVGRSARRAVPTIRFTIRARDFSFKAPGEVPAGLVRVRIVDDGGELHQAQVARLHDGVTFAQVRAAAARSGNDAALLALVDPMGGPNAIEPGGSATTIDELTPGSYALICFIRSADGVSHYARGMVAPFTVHAAKGRTVRPPKVKGTVRMSDFTYAFPDPMPRKGTVLVRNVGQQAHELGLFRVDPGTTLDEAKREVLGLPASAKRTVHAVGGIGGLRPGDTGYVELDLRRGRYVAVCFFPDPTKGNVPHLLEGMFQELEIK